MNRKSAAAILALSVGIGDVYASPLSVSMTCSVESTSTLTTKTGNALIWGSLDRLPSDGQQVGLQLSYSPQGRQFRLQIGNSQKSGFDFRFTPHWSTLNFSNERLSAYQGYVNGIRGEVSLSDGLLFATNGVTSLRLIDYGDDGVYSGFYTTYFSAKENNHGQHTSFLNCKGIRTEVRRFRFDLRESIRRVARHVNGKF